MSEHAEALQQLLIRNFNGAPLHHEQREPLYDTRCARLARDTAARKLGASIDIVAPGMRSCPYHFHHAEEEMFIILEGPRNAARGWRDAAAARAQGFELYWVGDTAALPRLEISRDFEFSPKACEFGAAGGVLMRSRRSGRLSSSARRKDSPRQSRSRLSRQVRPRHQYPSESRRQVEPMSERSAPPR